MGLLNVKPVYFNHLTKLRTVIVDGIVLISPESQSLAVEKARNDCYLQPPTSSYLENGTYCERLFDGVMCWPDTLAGLAAIQPCPSYIHGSQIAALALKQCTENGTWFFDWAKNSFYTDYSKCLAAEIPMHPDIIHPLIVKHLAQIQRLYSVGYGLSLISLILAVVIMSCFKKLRCPRNTVHLNLFVSFILRAIMAFTKDLAFRNGVGLASDIVLKEDGSVTFDEDGGSHWQCRLLIAVFNYALAANCMWIFVEGLYLHMLIFVSVFSENSGVRWYILIGWLAPLSFIIPWVIVRIFLDNTLCWNTNPVKGYFWIVKFPQTALVVANFVFFIRIVIVLFVKLRSPVTATNTRLNNYVKLAKSTLILIPLFGVHYIVFLFMEEDLFEPGALAELIKLYFEMFFNSFQGFFVAVLFCFCNAEVQGELKKRFRCCGFKWPKRNRSLFNNTSMSAVAYSAYASPLRDSNGEIATRSTPMKKLKNQDLERTKLTSNNNGQRHFSSGAADDVEISMKNETLQLHRLATEDEDARRSLAAEDEDATTPETTSLTDLTNHKSVVAIDEIGEDIKIVSEAGYREQETRPLFSSNGCGSVNNRLC